MATTVPGIGAAKSLHLGAAEGECEIDAFFDSKGPKPASILIDELVSRACIFAALQKSKRSIEIANAELIYTSANLVTGLIHCVTPIIP